MSDVANFLLVASTLVLIKSKSILPDLNLTKEEEEDIDLDELLAELESEELEEAKDYYEDFHHEMAADKEIVNHVEVENE